ncbi:hypothetical protein PG996_002769 [Apiospora saccharicola]|uniref:Uncharacterized protein n=1 Tax=Apiospora saccharicola TaxID=335842 RepID=A0ABR1WPR3_9PEZI
MVDLGAEARRGRIGDIGQVPGALQRDEAGPDVPLQADFRDRNPGRMPSPLHVHQADGVFRNEVARDVEADLERQRRVLRVDYRGELALEPHEAPPVVRGLRRVAVVGRRVHRLPVAHAQPVAAEPEAGLVPAGDLLLMGTPLRAAEYGPKGFVDPLHPRRRPRERRRYALGELRRRDDHHVPLFDGETAVGAAGFDVALSEGRRHSTFSTPKRFPSAKQST